MRPPVSVRRLLVLLLIGALASAGPLAYASPPDPAWIAGFWDDGDYDDVVLLATSGVSLADPRPSYERESVAAVLETGVGSVSPVRGPAPPLRASLGHHALHFGHDSLCNATILAGRIAPVDLVYPLAAVVGVAHYVGDPHAVLNVNINGTQNVL